MPFSFLPSLTSDIHQAPSTMLDVVHPIGQFCMPFSHWWKWLRFTLAWDVMPICKLWDTAAEDRRAALPSACLCSRRRCCDHSLVREQPTCRLFLQWRKRVGIFHKQSIRHFPHTHWAAGLECILQAVVKLSGLLIARGGRQGSAA